MAEKKVPHPELERCHHLSRLPGHACAPQTTHSDHGSQGVLTASELPALEAARSVAQAHLRVPAPLGWTKAAEHTSRPCEHVMPRRCWGTSKLVFLFPLPSHLLPSLLSYLSRFLHNFLLFTQRKVSGSPGRAPALGDCKRTSRVQPHSPSAAQPESPGEGSAH